MDKKIKYKVFDWIIYKMEKGENYNDISECLKDIGLNSKDKENIELVNKIFQWNNYKTIENMIDYFEYNN